MDGAFATLRMNGWVLDATEREAAELFEQVAAGDLDEPTLAAWLERNSMAV
jgi:prophage maintenance system killer protein